MAIELSKRNKKKLEELLIDALHNLRVCGNYLDLNTTGGLYELDKHITDDKRIKKYLDDVIGKTPICNFIKTQINEKLSRLYEPVEWPRSIVPLNSLKEFTDIDSIAKNLIDDFDSLPKRYCLSFWVNKNIPLWEGSGVDSMSESIRFVSHDELIKAYPLCQGVDDINETRYLSWAKSIKGKNELYLQLECDGYIDQYRSTRTYESAISMLKSVLGICIAVDLFEITIMRIWRGHKREVYLHEKIDDSWGYISKCEFSRLSSEAIAGMEISGKTLLMTDAQISEYAKEKVCFMKPIFMDNNQKNRIMLASKWLFDSLSSEDDLLSFVQATTSLEILIGDKNASEAVGLGELLRNRCAYLIAIDHNDREEILNKFKQIYNVRSKIVHAGKDRLDEDDKYLLTLLRSYVSRVIKKEISFFHK